MTQPEQDAALGDLVKRYSEAKRHRAAIVAELSKHGRTLKDIGQFLIASDEAGRNRVQYAPIGQTYPSRETLSDLVEDLKATNEHIRQC